jgi:hypothetical protein
VGFCEKSEFVVLLLEHRAGNIAVEDDFTSEIDQIMQNRYAAATRPISSPAMDMALSLEWVTRIVAGYL